MSHALPLLVALSQTESPMGSVESIKRLANAPTIAT
jgi:hypothetical protein